MVLKVISFQMAQRGSGRSKGPRGPQMAIMGPKALCNFDLTFSFSVFENNYIINTLKWFSKNEWASLLGKIV